MRNSFGNTFAPVQNNSENSPGASKVTGNFSRDVGQEDNEIVCSCNSKACLLTVKKEGPNQGKYIFFSNNKWYNISRYGSVAIISWLSKPLGYFKDLCKKRLHFSVTV